MSNYRRYIHEAVLPGHRLGRHVNHDPRSLAFQVHAAGGLKTVLWDRKVPVLDQGDLGSCTGNAAVGAIGTDPDYSTLDPATQGKLDEAEAVALYSVATTLDNYPGYYKPGDPKSQDTGSDGLSVAKAAKAAGLISGYLHATSVAAMNTALQSGPVIVGVNWYGSFDAPDPTTGLVTLGGSVRGGHEFEVAGYDVTADVYTAWNSWGTGWGLEGMFRIPGKVMAQLLSEDGDCTQLLPLSVQPPKPAGDVDLDTWWAASESSATSRHVGSNKAAATAARVLAAAKGL